MKEKAERKSYSQFGEDVLLSRLLRAPQGFYVDVGAHDPWIYSNTAVFHLRGWSGINIDADERAIERFNLARPGDVNVLSGVSDCPGTLEFARFANGAVNSFDPKLAEHQVRVFGQPEMHLIAVETLATLLERHMPSEIIIDYMNIDCEGLDFNVLKGNDWSKFRPRIVSVEIHGLNLNSPVDNPTWALLAREGYVCRGHYFVTSIFQHKSELS